MGGLLKVRMDGEETWLCRFSGTCLPRYDQAVPAIGGPAQGENRNSVTRRSGRKRSAAPSAARRIRKGTGRLSPVYGKRTVFLEDTGLFKDYKGRVALMLLGLMLSSVFNVVWPYLTGTMLYDRVLGRDADLTGKIGHPGRILALMLLILVLSAAGAQLMMHITGVIHGRQSAYIVPGSYPSSKQSVFASLRRLSTAFSPEDRQAA